MKAIEKTLEYHELLMVCNDLNQKIYSLPKGYTFEFFNSEQDVDAWADIHISSGEFTSKERAKDIFHLFYDKFKHELSKRCFFIVFENEKIATATISPTDEHGYKCVIDWLAIKREFQGQGLGKPLISKCLQVAKELGYDKVLLHTQTHTWLAAKLYLDLGFELFLTNLDVKGWQILKTITNHPKLKDFAAISESEMFDQLALNIVAQLNKRHHDYDYEIWYKNNQNDVYVNENGKFFHYKFFDNGKRLEIFYLRT